ncbi:carbohydrate ABC transporter permease [Paenibacillus doosanensis]|uniref:carbohydrate ABC transporter permease n=1 Tax=Paenibacillus doosanensis TaxID=1229154 RepID=UPI00217FDC87|nr:carbohydrate ABC transporter permease [Paenibacillus doosanensis]MCS7462864.1 carbohydrate ABC transporter permease [Paenibacillus doosanensis]
MDLGAREGWGDRLFNAVNLAVLSVILVAVLYPLIFVISASISDPMLVLQGKVWLWPKALSFEAYHRVFQNGDILIGYRNTILYTLAGTFINIVLTVAGAYPLARKDFVGRNVLMALFTFTMFFSGGIIPTYLVVKSLGIVNTFWVMVLPNAVSVFNLIIMRTFFHNSIPIELQESAFMDGASNLRILWNIVLPLSKPVIAVLILYYAVGHWNSFFNALIYLSDRARYPLQLILRELLIQNQMEQMLSGDSESMVQQMMIAEGLKYAIIIVSSLPVLIMYPFLQKYFEKGMMIGAIKG